MDQLHFINTTNKVSLDKTSKTEIRVQVMREYHRRRKHSKTWPTPELEVTKEPLSGQPQTLKFRLDREKTLQPWVRIKPFTGKNDRAALHKRENVEKVVPQPSVSHRHNHQGTEKEPTSSGSPDVEEEVLESLEQSGNLDSALPLVKQWHSAFRSLLHNTPLYQNPSMGALDPFSSMALLITPRTQLLLHHYFNVRLASSWLMMPMRKGLFSLATHDAALFHTFMSHYVAAYSLRFSTGDPVESMQHRTQAIRIVNERLRDPKQALSDGNIAAVANMAVYESSNGSTESMKVHLNGLVEMVNLRGGIQRGGFAPHVRRLIGWTDLHCASTLSSKPRFPPLGIPVTEGPGDASLRFPADSHSPDQSIKRDDIGMEESLAQIRALSATMAVLGKQSTLPEENIWYSDKIYALQHRLFDVMHSPADQRGELDRACSIAALIFCSTCLRDIGFNFRVIANAVKRLKEAISEFLENHLIPRVDLPHGVKLFWILGLGGVASEGKEERWWFVEKFRRMAAVLGLRGWEDAQVLLESVLWQEDLNTLGSRLWAQAHSTIW